MQKTTFLSLASSLHCPSFPVPSAVSQQPPVTQHVTSSDSPWQPIAVCCFHERHEETFQGNRSTTEE